MAPATSASELSRSLALAVLRAPVAGRTWREVLYLLLGAAIAAFGLGLTVTFLALGTALTVTLIGVPFLAVTIQAARRFAGVHRWLGRALLHDAVDAPPPRPAATGFFDWLGSALRDPAAWRAIAYSVLAFPLRAIGAYATVLGWALAVTSATYPIWAAPPSGGSSTVVALALVLTMPWVVRGFVWLDRYLVRALLGPGAVSARLRDLEDTRALAVDDAAATLRRIERDLHDGTQARLVAMAMQLDMAKEKLAHGARSSPSCSAPADRATASPGSPPGSTRCWR